MILFIFGFIGMMFAVCGLDSSNSEGCMIACLAGLMLMIVGASQMSDKGEK